MDVEAGGAYIEDDRLDYLSETTRRMSFKPASPGGRWFDAAGELIRRCHCNSGTCEDIFHLIPPSATDRMASLFGGTEIVLHEQWKSM